jgi:hypothetical protein
VELLLPSLPYTAPELVFISWIPDNFYKGVMGFEGYKANPKAKEWV